MPTLDTDPMSPTANSFTSVNEFVAYLDTRLWVPAAVVSADQPTREKALIMATRTIVNRLSPMREYIGGDNPYYRTRSTWTGQVATTTQHLPWPRLSMSDRNNQPIASTIFPPDLKNATSEMALQLLTTDRTAENPVIAAGLTDLKAGSVSLSFKENFEVPVIPDSVMSLLVPSWLTDVQIEGARTTIFEVL